MKATTVMLTVTLGLGLGACAGERASAPEEPTPSVQADEAGAREAGRVGEPMPDDVVEPKAPDATEPSAVGEGEDAGAAGEAAADGGEVAQASAATTADAGEAAKSAEPGAAGEPAKAVGSVPSAVFAAVVNRKRWSVDMTEFEGMDVAALEKKLSHALETRGEDAARRELKEGDPLMPAGFAVGDPWTLVTRKGAEHRTAESFAARVMGGSGKLHLYVRLGAVTGKQKGPAIAVRGHLPLTTTLTVPEPLAASAIDSGLRKRIHKAVSKPVARALKDETPELRKAVQAIPIRAKDVKAYPGRFPGDRTHVLFVQTGPASEDFGIAISGVSFMKADGSVEHHRLADELGWVSLLGLLDVDGDGLDEVFYEDQYHEGWSLVMLHWDGDVPRSRVLTGDGL